ncbi:MAG TPA: hypothetical protein VGA05_02500 [Candidatus Bathyarchaeia archaeon]
MQQNPKKGPLQSIKILDLEIARNTPESQVWASGPVTTLIPRFSLGEEYRFEDHGSSLFCALKWKTHQYQFQLARALQKKMGQEFFLATRECCLDASRFKQSGQNKPGSGNPATYGPTR